MGELIVHFYLGPVEFFAGLLPERFKEAARTGPMWRRILLALFVGLGSLIVGLVVAAFATSGFAPVTNDNLSSDSPRNTHSLGVPTRRNTPPT